MWHLCRLLVLLGLIVPLEGVSAQRLKDFRGTPQTIALMGASAEFVDSTFKDQILQQLRKNFNRYSRSYGEASVGSFKLGQNLNDQFHRPVAGTMSDAQKEFLKNAAKDNSVDIFALASIREGSEPGNYELEGQLYDARIEVLSAVEKTSFNRNTQIKNLEDFTYRLASNIDKEGFAHPSVQDLLEKPVGMSGGMGLSSSSISAGAQDFSLSPTDLTGGTLGGRPIIGGERTPFWERWWFWGLVLGGVTTASGLSYYFLVVDQDPSRANVTFRFP